MANCGATPVATRTPAIIDDRRQRAAAQDRSRRALMRTEGIITCPKCGHLAAEQMPTDACQFFYDCKGCGERLKPLPGDCCVFCSYGSVRCPPIQAGQCCS